MIKKISIIVILIITSILFANYESDIQEIIEDSKTKRYSESEQQLAIAGYQYNKGYFQDALKSLCKADSLGIPKKLYPPFYFSYSLVYNELGNFKKALEFNEKVLEYWSYDRRETFYPIEFYNLYFKFKLGEKIEEEKNNFLKKFKIQNVLNQYSLCDFLLKVEDYQSALSAIKDYDAMLIDQDLNETNIQYILFVHVYYELSNYKKAKENISKAMGKKIGDNSKSYLQYWDSLINYKLGNIKEAVISLQKGEDLGWDYHGRFILLKLWRFSEKNIQILEMIEKSADNKATEKK